MKIRTANEWKSTIKKIIANILLLFRVSCFWNIFRMRYGTRTTVVTENWVSSASRARELCLVYLPCSVYSYKVHSRIWWRPRKESKTRKIWKYYASWSHNLVIKNVSIAISEAQLTSTWQSVHLSVPLVLVCCKYSLLVRSQ